MFEVERYLRRGGRLHCSLLRPFGSSKPGVCGANNSFVDLITQLPHFSPLQIEIAQLTYRYKYIPFPNLKKYYGRQELYSQSHKIQYKKALLAQDWVLR